jgi:hypothetical protein
MTRFVRRAMVPIVAGAAIVAAAAPASARVHDGHINVAVGNVTILRNVSVGVGGRAAAGMCGMRIGPVVRLAVAVDQDSRTRTVCISSRGRVELRQNA